MSGVPKNKRGRPPSYPWLEWLGCPELLLIRGKDYMVASYIMAQQFRNVVREFFKRQVRAHIVIQEGDGQESLAITMRLTGPNGKLSPPEPLSLRPGESPVPPKGRDSRKPETESPRRGKESAKQGQGRPIPPESSRIPSGGGKAPPNRPQPIPGAKDSSLRKGSEPRTPGGKGRPKGPTRPKGPKDGNNGSGRGTK